MNRAARVIPDVATFAVDDGFWYSIPEHLVADLHLGSIVRVPLSGRRVRGWVVELAGEREGKLKDVSGISGSTQVFDHDLLKSLLWAAHHYVTPMAVMLSRATPPNLPRRLPAPVPVPNVAGSPHALDDAVGRAAAGLTSPTTALVANWHGMEWVSSLGPLLAIGRSVLVIAASVLEVEALQEKARSVWGDVVVTVSGSDDASDTAAWESAQTAPRLVIGTPKTASWQIAQLGLAIVLEESRRAMKDRQTPTLHVRDVMQTRSRVEGFNLVFFGPTPGVELLAAGADVVRVRNRAWPLVEVIDRSEDAPGSGFLSARAVAAIVATAGSGRRVFVYTHRRLGSASTRCARCRTLRTCGICAARLGRVGRCPKCEAPTTTCSNCGGSEFEEMGTIPDRLVAELDRRLGDGGVGVHPADTLVTVGTERDLAGLEPVSLAVAADVDGMLMGIGYRTSEEALRQLARLGTLVSPGKGARLMLQTGRPDSLLVVTMRRGDPIPYLERVLVERAREGLPPSIDMIAVEIRGSEPPTVPEDLESLGSGRVTVLGPMPVDDGRRWLIMGELGRLRLELRPMVGRWRDKGATVRIDADPIDV